MFQVDDLNKLYPDVREFAELMNELESLVKKLQKFKTFHFMFPYTMRIMKWGLILDLLKKDFSRCKSNISRELKGEKTSPYWRSGVVEYCYGVHVPMSEESIKKNRELSAALNRLMPMFEKELT